MARLGRGYPARPLSQPFNIYLAPANKTLAAAADSYAVTGTAATLKLGRKAAAAAGSHVVTGSTATLRRGLPLVAGSGSYAVTGTAATLKAGRKAVAAAGSYAVTGTAATLSRSTLGATLSAAAGSYAASGQATSLKLVRNLVIEADEDLYSVNGEFVDLFIEVARALTAGASSYAVTGTAASFVYNHRLTAAVGSYAVTGTVATLLVTGVGARILVAGVGSYAITGTAATLKRGSLVAAAASSYAVTGVVAALKRGLKNAAAAGFYATTGTAASLKFGRKNAAAAGSYLVSGQAASLAKSSGGNKTLVASAGSYSTDVEGGILGTVSNPNNQFTVLRRPGDPLFEQFIIWSDFDLIQVTDPDQFERLELIGSNVFRIHFRDLTTTIVSLSNPFAMTSGSAVVRVTHTAHGRRTGEFVRFSGAGTVGGIQINGSGAYEYQITYVSDDTYDITNRLSVIIGGTPFAMTNGSPVVRVTHTAHGRSTGNTIFFSDTDFAGGIKIYGAYAITFVDANHYDITHSAAATSTATGGGSSTTVDYEVTATSTATGGGASVVATYNEFKIILDSSFSSTEAEALALIVAPRVGKLPRLVRQNLNNVQINPGSTAFFAGEGTFILSKDRIHIRVAYNDLEESCFHESMHGALEERYQGKGLAYSGLPAWEAARVADNAFIDDYSTTNIHEDFAQGGLASYAMMTHPERFTEPARTNIANQIPNRLAFFRNVVFTDHFTACARVPAANVVAKLPTRFIDSLVNNTSLLSHCRDIANLKVEAYYSRPDLVVAGIPDVYKFFCNICGRAHQRTCNGNEPRAFWEAH